MNTAAKCCLLLCAVLMLPTLAPGQSKFGWTLVWSDEFNQADGTSPDPAKWTYDTGGGGWGNGELEYYTARTNNVRIEGGKLIIEARQENYSGAAYTSGRIKSKGRVSWRYGRIEARIQIPRGQGLWPAFWMMGTNIDSVGWPTCGEIDIMENIGAEPGKIHGTVHGPGYSGGNGIGGPYLLPSGAVADDFHIFAVEWTTNQLKWFVDGQQYFGVNPASLPTNTTWVYTAPQFVLLNVAVGGNWPGIPNGSTTFPQRMTVDYVRVYAATNLPASGGNSLANPGFETGGLADWKLYGAGFNTSLQTIHDRPVHEGSNVFKVFGQFTGAENYSGAFQDIPATAGQNLLANGWAFTPSDDAIAGANTSWVEVSFHDAASNSLSLYRSAKIDTTTPSGVWLNLAVTNQLNPITAAVIGTVTNLVAPASTSFARFQIVFRQPTNDAGAILFDDLRIRSAAIPEFTVPVSFAHGGNYLNLSLATYLGLGYLIRWKPSLSDSTWQIRTNLTGTGSAQTISLGMQSPAGFYRIVRPED